MKEFYGRFGRQSWTGGDRPIIYPGSDVTAAAVRRMTRQFIESVEERFLPRRRHQTAQRPDHLQPKVLSDLKESKDG